MQEFPDGPANQGEGPATVQNSCSPHLVPSSPSSIHVLSFSYSSKTAGRRKAFFVLGQAIRLLEAKALTISSVGMIWSPTGASTRGRFGLAKARLALEPLGGTYVVAERGGRKLEELGILLTLCLVGLVAVRSVQQLSRVVANQHNEVLSKH